ncbi:MAG: gas vesicle protein [Streptosporangiaceae bacterium]
MSADQAGLAVRHERIALVDLLDRVLAGGVVVAGDITLAIEDVDLVTISLRAIITSVTALTAGGDAGSGSAARAGAEEHAA